MTRGNYLYLDSVVSSSVRLPLRDAPSNEIAKLSIDQSPIPDDAHRHFLLTYHWESEDGKASVEIRTHNANHIITLHRKFHYLIDGHENSIVFEQLHDDLSHHLMNMILPMAFSLKEKIIFHGAAVRINGRALIFLGDSGLGKSTLAAALAHRGGELIGDDCLAVWFDGKEWLAYPSYPSLRLWPDSIVKALGRSPEDGVKVNSYCDKRNISIGDLGKVVSDGLPTPIAGIYQLAIPAGLEGSGISIRPLKTIAAFSAILSGQFRMAKKDRQETSNEFKKIAEMLRKIPVMCLDYPRQFDQLDTVCSSIINHATPGRTLQLKKSTSDDNYHQTLSKYIASRSWQ